MSTSRRAAGVIALSAVLTAWTVVQAQQRPAPPKGPALVYRPRRRRSRALQ